VQPADALPQCIVIQLEFLLRYPLLLRFLPGLPLER
jgi:hypothetical protein